MMLHVTSVAAVLASFLSAAHAQRAVIGFPQDGASISAGSELIVEIDRPNSLSGSTEVAIVVGLQSCFASTCRPVTDGLGTILYNGGYKPEFQPGAPGSKPPHQNFTVVVPSNFATGQARLGVLHVSLIGAGRAPFQETMNITLNIV